MQPRRPRGRPTPRPRAEVRALAIGVALAAICLALISLLVPAHADPATPLPVVPGLTIKAFTPEGTTPPAQLIEPLADAVQLQQKYPDLFGAVDVEGDWVTLVTLGDAGARLVADAAQRAATNSPTKLGDRELKSASRIKTKPGTVSYRAALARADQLGREILALGGIGLDSTWVDNHGKAHALVNTITAAAGRSIVAALGPDVAVIEVDPKLNPPQAGPSPSDDSDTAPWGASTTGPPDGRGQICSAFIADSGRPDGVITASSCVPQEGR